jgi:hypothetical protein
MRIRFALLAIALTFSITAVAFQANFKQYPGEEDNPTAVPSGAFERTEWTVAPGCP